MIKKRNLLKVALISLLAVCFGLQLAACDKDVKTDPVLVTGITITGTGVTGAGTKASPYTITLDKGDTATVNYAVAPADAANKTLTVSYAPDAEYATTAATSDKISLTAVSPTINVASLPASVAGDTYYYVLTASDASGIKAYGRVIIAEDNTPIEKLVTSVTLSGAGLSGAGTIASPYLIEVEKSAAASLTYVVAPVDADNKNLVVEYASDATFATKSTTSDKISVTPSSTPALTVNVASLAASEHDHVYYYILNTADSSDVKVYCAVKVKPLPQATMITIVEDTAGAVAGGAGTVADPYRILIPRTQNVKLSYDVAPYEASIDLKVVFNSGADFETANDTNVSTNLDVSSLYPQMVVTSLVGDSGDMFYFYVQSVNGGYKAYCSVELTAFTAVENLTLDTSNSLTAVSEQAWDYEYVTMAGTNLNIGRGQNDTRKTAWNNLTSPLKIPNVADGVRYYYELYSFNFTANKSEGGTPSDSSLKVAYFTDAALTTEITENDTPVIFTASVPNGKTTTVTYEAKTGGATVFVKLYSKTNASVYEVIKVTTVESAHPGIFAEDLESLTPVVVDQNSWNFDETYDANGQGNRDRFATVHYSILDSNDSTNNKIFLMGGTEKPYGFSLENNPSSAGVVGSLHEVIWTYAAIPASATNFRINIGTNDRVSLNARVLLVDPTGVLQPHVLLDWTALKNPDNQRNYGFTAGDRMPIPGAYKGVSALIVIEGSMTAATNTELQVKGMWVDVYTPVTGVTFADTTKTYGQGATYDYAPDIAPANATNSALTYTVSPEAHGVTVSNNGRVTILANATVGNYVITATSVDNPAKSASYTLSVTLYTPVDSLALNFTSFTATYAANINAGNNQTIVLTDKPVQLIATFNAGGVIPTITTINWEIISGSDVVSVDNGLVTFLKAGTAKVKATSADNSAAFAECDITVVAYVAATSVVATGVSINKTEADNKAASTLTGWNGGSAYGEWTQRIVGGRHSSNKIIPDTNWIRAEAHTNGTAAGYAGPNWVTPTVVVWNKVSVPAGSASFSFDAAAHNDANQYFRFNYRLRLIEVTGGTYGNVVTLKDWTSVSKPTASNQQIPYTIAADISAYAGKTVIIIIEGAAAWQDGSTPTGGNGNGWMWIRNLRISATAVATSGYTLELAAITGGTLTGNTLEITVGNTATLPSLTFANYKLVGAFTALKTNGTGNIDPTISATGTNTAVATYNSSNREIAAVAVGETSINVVYKNLVSGNNEIFVLNIKVVAA